MARSVVTRRSASVLGAQCRAGARVPLRTALFTRQTRLSICETRPRPRPVVRRADSGLAVGGGDAGGAGCSGAPDVWSGVCGDSRGVCCVCVRAPAGRVARAKLSGCPAAAGSGEDARRAARRARASVAVWPLIVPPSASSADKIARGGPRSHSVGSAPLAARAAGSLSRVVPQRAPVSLAAETAPPPPPPRRTTPRPPPVAPRPPPPQQPAPQPCCPARRPSRTSAAATLTRPRTAAEAEWRSASASRGGATARRS